DQFALQHTQASRLHLALGRAGAPRLSFRARGAKARAYARAMAADRVYYCPLVTLCFADRDADPGLDRDFTLSSTRHLRLVLFAGTDITEPGARQPSFGRPRLGGLAAHRARHRARRHGAFPLLRAQGQRAAADADRLA